MIEWIQERSGNASRLPEKSQSLLVPGFAEAEPPGTPSHSTPWLGSSVGGWGTNLQKTSQNQVSPTTPTFPESTHLGTVLGDFTHLKVEARGPASLVPGCNTPVNTVCTCCGISTPTSNLGAVWNCNRAAVCHRGRERVKCPFFVHFLWREKVNKNWNSWEETW